jgi:hypothetical protein
MDVNATFSPLFLSARRAYIKQDALGHREVLLHSWTSKYRGSALQWLCISSRTLTDHPPAVEKAFRRSPRRKLPRQWCHRNLRASCPLDRHWEKLTTILQIRSFGQLGKRSQPMNRLFLKSMEGTNRPAGHARRSKVKAFTRRLLSGESFTATDPDFRASSKPVCLSLHSNRLS